MVLVGVENPANANVNSWNLHEKKHNTEDHCPVHEHECPHKSHKRDYVVSNHLLVLGSEVSDNEDVNGVDDEVATSIDEGPYVEMAGRI